MKLAKHIFLWSSLLLLAVSLISFLPGLMVAEWLCSFRLQYAVVALVLLAGTIVLQSKGGIALSAISLLVNLACILPWYFGPVEPSSGGQLLKLYVANVHRENADFEAVFDQIDRLDPDLVFLQEIDPDFDVGIRALLEGFEEIHSQPRVDRFGTMMLCRFPLDTVIVDTFPLVRFEGGFIPYYRARGELARNPIDFFLVHTIPPVPKYNFRDRTRQFLQAGEWAARQKGNAIVAGDLNASIYSPALKKLQSAGGLNNARRGFGLLNTWPTGFWPLRTNLDQVLYKGDMRVVKMIVLEDIGSDHFPLYVEFELPPVSGE